MLLSDNVVFWRTPDFINSYGSMDSATYAYLKEQVIAGKGDVIAMAGGLRLIEIAVQIPARTHQCWLVVFAIYQAMELVVFITKYPVDADGYILISTVAPESRRPLQHRKKLTTKQQMSLARTKKSLDKAVGTRFRRTR